MANGGPSTPQPVTSAGAQKNLTPLNTPQSEAAQSKRDLASWWKGFKRGNQKLEEHKAPTGIFGVPLSQSIRYANVAISLFNDDGQSYIYGYVPIVVAKCGVFLKEKATETEGIFRLAGSEKRIKELKTAFDSPERYGKGLDWAGYTVHDAANILRRYFNQLPEPIIPLDFYERFREPLRNHQGQAVGADPEAHSATETGFNADVAIRSYQALITELPPLNRQLLLYILDLLAVFASKSDLNKMTTPNLSAIFQPGILSHPQHDMAPQEYRLSQDVLIFLIENQDSFLIGMHGTAADEKTVKEVQSGYPTASQSGSPTGPPSRSRTVVGRSSSNASGASQGRKLSGIRRNVSSSSRNSRQSSIQGGPPAALGSPSLNAGGVHRSNTVPSQRPGASPRFSYREKSSDPPTPNSNLPPPMEPIDPIEESPIKPSAAAILATTTITAPAAPDIVSASSSEATTPLAAPGSDTSSAILLPKERFDREVRPTIAVPTAPKRDVSHERTGSRNLLDIFRQTSGSGMEQLNKGEQRQPRKLQKKRLPGSSLSSAHSSAADLGNDTDDAADSIASPVTPQHRETDPMNAIRSDPSEHQAAILRAAATEPLQPPRALSEALRPGSPHQSVQSRTSITDVSDIEYLDDPAAAEKQAKKKRWRFSHSSKSKSIDVGQDTGSKTTPPIPSLPVAVSASASPEMNRANPGATTVTSAQGDAAPATGEPNHGDHGGNGGVLSDEEKKKGPMSWIRGKIHERKEKEAEKRTKSPTGHHEHRRSIHVGRDGAEPSKGGDVAQQSTSTAAQRPKSIELPRQSPPTAAPISVAQASQTQADEAVVEKENDTDDTPTPTGGAFLTDDPTPGQELKIDSKQADVGKPVEAVTGEVAAPQEKQE